MDKQIIEFLKGLMQPLLTIAMVIIFMEYSLSGKFAPDQVWQVVVGIIVFWFGYTAFKFGLPKTDESAKQSDLLEVIKKQQDVIANATYDLGESVPVKAVTSTLIPTITSTGGTTSVDINATPEDKEPDLDLTLEQIKTEAFNDLKEAK